MSKQHIQNTSFLGVTLPAGLHQWVKEQASHENRSVTKQVVQLLEEAKAARENKPTN